MPFQIIVPQKITQANIASYSVTQDIPIYNSATTYAKGALVILDSFGAIVYESLIVNNLGNTPTKESLQWLKRTAPSNYSGMFDERVGTVTKSISNINISINTTDFINNVAFLGIDKVRKVIVKSVVNNVEVWSAEQITSRRKINGILDIWFGKHEQVSDVIFDNLPKYKNQQVQIQALGGTGVEVEIGGFIMGFSQSIGETEWGLTTSRKHYSTIKEQFGIFSFIKRFVSSKELNVQLVLPPNRVAQVEELLAKLDAVPALFIASKKYQSTIVYGIVDSFSHQFSDLNHAYNNLKIKGIG